ncbi:hypothetical protein [Williamsia sterculiae]|nr:hypothetical protein [Williamsia sterculiae]
MSGAVSGSALALDSGITIVHAGAKNDWRSQLIICHEIAHVLLDHMDSPTAPAIDPALFPNLPQDLVAAALSDAGIMISHEVAHSENHYESADEYAAEFLGSQLAVLLLLSDREFANLRRARRALTQQNVLDTFLGPE